jgi:L-alanine-DL-glutamate epimerase-like enolase superfamily enzyme
MQITKAVVTPVEIKLNQPFFMAGSIKISQITAIFVRIETREGRNAWGCGVVQPELTGETTNQALRVFDNATDVVKDLHPTNIEFSLARLSPIIQHSPSAKCAFDLAFHDLLGLAAGLPLYRLLGGFRNRIQTSITIPLIDQQTSVEMAKAYAKKGFRMLKIKGGMDAADDVNRVKAIHRALPDHILRLDADGGYSVKQALEVARALDGEIEMLEQPVTAEDLEGLRQVTTNSPIPILADQSIKGPGSALELASRRAVNGVCVKLATCGGLSCARQIDTIARAAKIGTMVSCIIEPALLIAAGLSYALSSPNVRYGDLDGHFELQNDPTRVGFQLEDGWLVARDVPGLGCSLDI